jgi:acylpyruvate hydrolase
MKIICVGRNYVNHAKELNNPLPEEPVIFLKPDTALLKDNKAFYLPDFSKSIHYEAEVVLRICKNGKHIKEDFAHKYYDQISLGIDFTARDVQTKLKEKGLPWELSKAFDSSAVIGSMQAYKQADGAVNFQLIKNEKIVQNGNTSDMIFSFEKIIAFVSGFITLRQGDLIYTGTPEGVGTIEAGDRLTGILNESTVFQCDIK